MNRALRLDTSRAPAGAARHLLWFCDGLLLFFGLAWLSSTLRLDNDFYYAVFIWTALTFFYLYLRATSSTVVRWARDQWRWSLLLGGLASVYLVVAVWNANPTERPGGLLLAFEILWRGIAYGVVDALVLTAFPLAVAVGVFGADTSGVRRRVGISALTLTLVWVMSATYHLGFDQFDRSDLVTPQRATTVVAVPSVLTLNPVGSVMAQTVLHVAVTIRAFESDVLVPPEVEYIPPWEPPGVFGPR